MNKIYISGPISGIVDEARQQFERAEASLFEAGYLPVNPFRVDACPELDCRNRPHNSYASGEGDHTYGCYLRYDIQAMLDCDIVATLDGWESSKGAQLEHFIALQVDMQIRPLQYWLDQVAQNHS